MKKALLSLALILFLVVLVAPSAFAADADLVNDEANLLTDGERLELNAFAQDIAQEHRCDVVIVTVDNMAGNDAYEFAKSLHQKYGYGYGSDKSCLLLLLSVAERDYALVAYGYGNTAFTDYGKDVILDQHVLPLLAQNKYYEAFKLYLETADEYLSMARAGAPFDVAKGAGLGGKLLVIILLPLLIALIICLIWKKQMKTAVSARAADRYIPENGFQLTGQEDRFLFRTETRRKIEQKSSGGTTVDRSGYSGRSGKF